MKIAKTILAVALLACSATASAQYIGTVPGTEYVYETTSILGSRQQRQVISDVTIKGDTTIVCLTSTIDVPQQGNLNIDVTSFVQFTTPEAPTRYEIFSAKQITEIALNVVRMQLEASNQYSDTLMKQIEQYLLPEGECVLVLDPRASIGDEIPSSAIVINFGLVQFSIGIVNASVLGCESVSVPAGTFDNCLKIIYNNITKVAGQSVKLTCISWFAPGVGQVKIESRSEEGTVVETSELISFKP